MNKIRGRIAELVGLAVLAGVVVAAALMFSTAGRGGRGAAEPTAAPAVAPTSTEELTFQSPPQPPTATPVVVVVVEEATPTPTGVWLSFETPLPPLPPEALTPAPEELETYISRTLVVANVGDGPGELGIFIPAGGVKPGAITVDKQGNVYVLDSQNRRIAKFDPLGDFVLNIPLKPPIVGRDICAASGGLVYVLEGGKYGPTIDQITQRVKLLDEKGTVIREYFMPRWIDYSYDIELDSTGTLLLKGYTGYAADAPDSPFPVNRWVAVPLGNAERVYTVEEQRAAARLGLMLGKGHMVVSRQRKTDDGSEFVMYDDQDVPVVRVPLEKEDGARFVDFIDFDGVGNMYIYMASFFADHPLSKLRKLNPQGKVIAAFDIPNPDLVPKHDITVDEAGRVYYLWVKREQIQVIKWEKQE